MKDRQDIDHGVPSEIEHGYYVRLYNSPWRRAWKNLRTPAAARCLLRGDRLELRGFDSGSGFDDVLVLASECLNLTKVSFNRYLRGTVPYSAGFWGLLIPTASCNRSSEKSCSPRMVTTSVLSLKKSAGRRAGCAPRRASSFVV
jgi:hypothetical protein